MAIRVLLLVLVLSAISSSSSADVFESIDCGSDRSYVDVNGIKWKGDSDLIKNGEAKMVQRVNSISTVMDTLRVFKSRNKNCYNISVTKGGKILVRAGFFYGNYDLKSFPPSFELHFDGNYWSTVTTSIEVRTSYEIIYVPKRDVASICVAQTKPNQLPFISTLEVRSLGPLVYKGVGPDIALFTMIRTAYGTNTIVRFPDDQYDRIWNTIPVGSAYTKVVSIASSIDLTSIPDDPPQPVMLSAVTTTGSNTIPFLSEVVNVEDVVYVNVYFSEVMQLSSSQTRSFTITKDGKNLTDPITPPYGSSIERYSANMEVFPNTIISVVATSDSTLPPLVNAAEVFAMAGNLTDGTDNNDVEGLIELQYSASGFEVLQEWRGDPCLPVRESIAYSWEWINCTRDITPRVTALNLHSFGLEGPLPDFSSMNALEIIDLSNNSLSGAIPAFLGNFPNLKELNLGDNKFSGAVPSSLKKKTKLILVLSGNPDLCDSDKPCDTIGNGPPSPGGSHGYKKKSNNMVLILSVVIGCLALLIILVAVYFLFRNKGPSAGGEQGPNGGGHVVPGQGPSTAPQREKNTANPDTSGSGAAGQLTPAELPYPVNQQPDHDSVHKDPITDMVPTEY